jgi:hypothetical protein
VRSPWVRRGAGITVLLFGLFTLFAPGVHAGHGANHIDHMPSTASQAGHPQM